MPALRCVWLGDARAGPPLDYKDHKGSAREEGPDAEREVRRGFSGASGTLSPAWKAPIKAWQRREPELEAGIRARGREDGVLAAGGRGLRPHTQIILGPRGSPVPPSPVPAPRHLQAKLPGRANSLAPCLVLWCRNGPGQVE